MESIIHIGSGVGITNLVLVCDDYVSHLSTYRTTKKSPKRSILKLHYSREETYEKGDYTVADLSCGASTPAPQPPQQALASSGPANPGGGTAQGQRPHREPGKKTSTTLDLMP